MKQKVDSSDPVTRKILNEELGSFKMDVDFTLEKFRRDIDDKAKEYRDQILTKLDGVMGELESRRENDIIGTHQITELRKKTDNHEKRIMRLEHRQAA